MLASRWIPWTAALAGAAIACTVCAARERRVPMPPLPTPPPPAPKPVPSTVAVPCVGESPYTIHALEGDPVVCTTASCLRVDLDRRSVAIVARPADPPGPPLHRAATQVHAGPHLTSALTADAAATLDRATVVIGSELWSVAADRRVTLKPPDVKPWGPERELRVVGDLVLVKWFGDCTDSMCLVSELVDRNGREVAWTEAGGRVLAVDDRFFLAISEFSVLDVRDLHTGAQVSTFDPREHRGDFLDIARLDAGQFALLRDAGLAVEISILEIDDGHIAFGDRMVLPRCE